MTDFESAEILEGPSHSLNLLVEVLAVPVEEGTNAIEPDYSEELQYNVAPDGRPFVAVGVQAGTVTVTKVKQEHDDADPSPPTMTRTSIARESDDRD